MPKAIGEAQGRISGRIIIDQLVRNMELGQFEMGYSILAPCIFSLYLHPDNYVAWDRGGKHGFRESGWPGAQPAPAAALRGTFAKLMQLLKLNHTAR